MDLSRRHFLKLLGVSTAVAAVPIKVAFALFPERNIIDPKNIYGRVSVSWEEMDKELRRRYAPIIQEWFESRATTYDLLRS